MFPSPIAANVITVKKGTQLHRVHSKVFDCNSFNPGKGKQRFSPLKDSTDKVVPTIYAASTFECAVCETVFNDHIWMVGFLTVPKPKLRAQQYSILTCRHDLKLGSLFSPDLKNYGSGRAAIIDCNHAFDFTPTKLAENIHSNNPHIHGLIWTSRAHDAYQAYILFGDRVKESDLILINSSSVWEDKGNRLKILNLAKKWNIHIV